MLARGPTLCAVRATTCFRGSRGRVVCTGGIKHSARRHTSTSSPAARSAPYDGLAPTLTSLTDELDRIAPRFDLEADQIEIIRGPREFYSVLKSKILAAKRRIYLSTLYIGKTEHELIATIGSALQQNKALKISFLSDALRGTRETPDPTTASLLAPLISRFGPDRVQIRMYHTPNLTGLRKKCIPTRINEGWGLQHMKLYGIDDEVILSGANLSNDYFTNRVDRYHVFRSTELADYYYGIHEAVSSISFDVQPAATPAGYSMTWPRERTIPSPLNDPRAYISSAAELLSPLMAPSAVLCPAAKTTSTSVFPVFQMTPLFKGRPGLDDASTELPALRSLLRFLQVVPTLTIFTAGYFNPSASLVSGLLGAHSSSSINVITASRYANGFYGSRGVSGMLPAAYTLLCKRFLEQVHSRGLDGRVRLSEWRRGTMGLANGWTYHAKGIWATLSHASDGTAVAGPCVTLIGSSNYTKRSYSLDLEANALVITSDEGLQKQLKEETDWLRNDAKEVDLDDYQKVERRVGLHVRLAMWITQLVGGAL